MNTRTLATALSLSLAGASLPAAAQPAAPAGITVAIDDLKFTPMDVRRPDSHQMALLWGDPASGPSAMLIRFKRIDLPLHAHSADYHLLVVQGTMKHWDLDETAADGKLLGPGSYWYQPGGRAHRDACVSDECLVYLTWSGRRDGYAVVPPRP